MVRGRGRRPNVAVAGFGGGGRGRKPGNAVASGRWKMPGDRVLERTSLADALILVQ